jgi:hypothetical protein
MKIAIITIPHNNQRYKSVGDYVWENDDTLLVYVSDTGNKKYNFLIAIHEVIEAFLCEERGIKETDISAFDIKFENERVEGLHTANEEPGYAKDSPYMNEHFFAESIERLLAGQLNINWDEYDKVLEKL